MQFCINAYNQLKKLDIYGYNFPLRYKSETSYSTSCGLFFSLVSIFLVCLIIISYIVKMFSHSSFSIVTNSIYREELAEINLKNFPFMYGIYRDGKIQYFDHSYVNVTLDRNVHIPIKDDNNHTILKRISYPIILEKCNAIHFQNNFDLFKPYDYEKYLCPKIGQNLTFKGRYGDQVKGYDILEMHISKCNNESFFNKCKSNEEIEKYVTDIYVSLIYLSNTINHENFSYPVVNFLQSAFFTVSIGNVKRYYYFFSKEKYISNNGIIMNDIKVIDFFQYKYTLTDFIHKETSNFYSKDTLIEINFSCADIELEYERKYLRFNEVVGIIGGWIDLIGLIFSYISYFFSKKSFIIEMCNSLMSHNFHKMIRTKVQPNLSNRSSTTILFFKIKSLTQMKNNYMLKNTDHMVTNNLVKNATSRSSSTLSKNDKIFDFGNFRKSKKGFCFYFTYFIFPFRIIEKYQSYYVYSLYMQVYHKFMSIDIIIPFVLNSYISKDKIVAENKQVTAQQQKK